MSIEYKIEEVLKFMNGKKRARRWIHCCGKGNQDLERVECGIPTTMRKDNTLNKGQWTIDENIAHDNEFGNVNETTHLDNNEVAIAFAIALVLRLNQYAPVIGLRL